MKASTLLSALAILAISGTALGQAQIVPQDDLGGAGDNDIVGWNPSLAVSSTVNLVSNTNVVGQIEGTSVLFGLGLAGGADYIKGKGIWRNLLAINEGFAKTPVVDRFLKTNDEVSVTSTYDYFLTKFLGGFGRAKIATSLFNARAITAESVDYTILPAAPDGMARDVTSKQLKVSSAFKPLTLSYSAGGFAQPLNTKKLNLRVRGGLGGRHTLASGVLVVNDDDTTPRVELQELGNVHQAGVELFASLDGKSGKEDRLSYAAGVSVLIPFLNNDDYNRSALELTRIGVEASASVGVFDWMSIVYKGALIVDPQLFPADSELIQFQNSLLLTFAYTLIDREKGLVAMKKEAEAAAVAKEKEEAERKLREAEERARKAEEELERKKLEDAKPPVVTPPTPPTPDDDTDNDDDQ